MGRLLGTAAALAGLALAGAGQAQEAAPDKAAVVAAYADLAEAEYGDALAGAQRLQAAVNRLVSDPSAQALEAAKTAWLQARVPYQQTEVFRFGNPIVDEWEGKVNAWPLDEGLID